MKKRSAAENVRSSNGRTPSAIRTGGRPTTCMSLTSAVTTSSPSSRSSRADEVSGPRAEVEHGSLVRQPFTHLLDQLPGAPFHDGVEHRLQHRIASQQARRCARLVPTFEELAGEPEDRRPEAPLQISRVNRQGRDSPIQRLQQRPDPMPDVPEPAPATTIPGPGRQRNASAGDDSSEKKPSTCSSPSGFTVSVRTCPSCQPGARKPRAGAPKTSVKTRCPRSMVRCVSSRLRPFISSQRSASQRGRSPASLPSMEIAVKEKLLGGVLDQPAVVGMRRQRPLAVPVGDHAEGEAASEKGREIPDHHARLAGVGRSGVVDADEEGPHGSGS